MSADDLDTPSLYTKHHFNGYPSSTSALLAPFLLPNILTNVEDPSLSNGTWNTDLINSHFAAFKGIDLTETGKWTETRATTEVIAVCKAFPLVHNHVALLAMTAWFHLLCNVDDIIEAMDSDVAHRSLRQSIEYIQQSCINPDSELARGSPRQQQSPRATRSRHDSVTEAPPVIRPRETYSTDLPAASALRSDTVQAMTKAFVHQIKAALQPSTVPKVAQCIITVWQNMCTELDERWRSTGPTVKSYLAIRTHTVGLAPFFAVLEDCLCAGHDSEESLDSEQSDIRTLQAGVSLAVGLQNDLIGLKKDLATDEQLNLIRLLQRRDSLSLEEGLARAIQMHNDTVLSTLDCYSRLRQDVSKAHQIVLAESIIHFVRTHYAWATRSQRYQR